MKPITFPRKLLVMSVASAMSAMAFAEDTTTTTATTDGILPTIEVQATETEKPKVNVEQKTVEKIQQEMIRDTRDLVRYSTDVGIADDGRRLQGFSMRGVENNRVGISIDGIALPNSEENSLYARYGNFNNSRLGIDSELVRTIDIVKGSDSVNSGSGSLGGDVNYRTMEARDLVYNGTGFGGLYRAGYASKNREWVNTLGLGYVGNRIDFALMYSYRNGHELKSAGGKGVFTENTEIGSSRIKPDPSKHKYNSYLAKLGWQITPNNRIGASLSAQDNSNKVDEESYGLTTTWRTADDYQTRYTGNMFYEYLPSQIFSKIRFDLDYQRTKNGAVNNKGERNDIIGGDWRTGYIYGRTLTDIDDRDNLTKYGRATVSLYGQPFQFGGEHTLGFKAYYAKQDYENKNHDQDINGRTGQLTSEYYYSIQRPVKTTQYGFSLQDKIHWNDVFSSVAGVRYDYTKVAPQEFDAEYGCTNTCINDGNPSANTFGNWSGAIGLDAQLTDVWKTGFSIGTGYRVPTASEMYFNFGDVRNPNPAGNWRANPDLKAETSINFNVNLEGRGQYGDLDVNLHHTRYKNFLYEKETNITGTNELCSEYYEQLGYCTRTFEAPMQQMINLDNAKISGIEFKGRLNLNTVSSAFPEGFSTLLSAGYNRGTLSNGDDLLSIQPLKAVVGLDYEDPNGKWGVFYRTTYLGAKKAGDAKVTTQERVCKNYTYDPWFGNQICSRFGYEEQQNPYQWLNKSAVVLDFFGYYRPTDRITLRAGVYNITDKKYQNWDALRGINRYSTINSVDREGQGLQRFYAPGRNYTAAIEFKF